MKKLTFFAILIAIFLLVACPPEPSGNPCPGSCDCTASDCTHDDCTAECACQPVDNTCPGNCDCKGIPDNCGHDNCTSTCCPPPPTCAHPGCNALENICQTTSCKKCPAHCVRSDAATCVESGCHDPKVCNICNKCSDHCTGHTCTHPECDADTGLCETCGDCLAEHCECLCSGCEKFPCKCRDFTFNGAKKAIPEFATPSTNVVTTKDVKVESTKITIREAVNDLIIIDADGYGWQASTPVSANSPSGVTVTGDLVTPIKVYAKNASGQWYEAGTDFVDPDTRTDFSASGNHQKLGLSNGPYTGTSLISAMEDRWTLAQNDSGAVRQFYPIGTLPEDSTVIDGETLDYCSIYGSPPGMAFLVKGSSLTIWGMSAGAGIDTSISFDIAIINNDGRGWLHQGSDGSPWKTEWFSPSEGRKITLSLLSLTKDNVSSVDQLTLGGYEIYIIVRSTSLLESYSPDGDFNHTTCAFNDRNVIKPKPR